MFWSTQLTPPKTTPNTPPPHTHRNSLTYLVRQSYDVFIDLLHEHIQLVEGRRILVLCVQPRDRRSKRMANTPNLKAVTAQGRGCPRLS